MKDDVLVGLIDMCVSQLESVGLAELTERLHAELQMRLKATDEDDFANLVQAARLIAFSHSPMPIDKSITILLDVAAAHMPRGRSIEALTLVERALDLAADNGFRNELRRACNVYAVISVDVGVPSRGVEYALRGAAIAHELGDEVGVAACFANMTGALCAMGLYRETISVGLRLIKRFKTNSSCTGLVSNTRGNMANAALALRHYSLATEAARESCEAVGLPRDAQGLLNRVIAEGIWLKSAIGLKDEKTAQARLKMIQDLASAFKSPRMDMNRDLAEAAYEIFAGDLTIAVAKLLEMLKKSKGLPGVYRDNLVLLVKAYEKGNDHAGALLYLGELVEFLGKSQVAAVRGKLEAIKERVQTPMPGKDDVRAVINAIQRIPGSQKEEIEVPESMYRDALERLAVSAELREDSLGRHAYRVGKLAGLLAEAAGYGSKFCMDVELAARLHDIGKLGIPDGLLMKPGKLSEAEFKVMERHTVIGAQVLQQCSHPAFRLAEQIAMFHHEWWDGTGYPRALVGETIPVVARIAALADVYDALAHRRPYKDAWTHEKTVELIAQESGTHFEPRLAELFISMVNALRIAHPGEAFDDYLSQAGKYSTFLQARDQMHQMLNDMEPILPGELL